MLRETSLRETLLDLATEEIIFFRMIFLSYLSILYFLREQLMVVTDHKIQPVRPGSFVCDSHREHVNADKCVITITHA